VKNDKFAQYFSQIIGNNFLRNRKLYRKKKLKWTLCVCVCVCVCVNARASKQGEYLLAQYRISCDQGSESPSSIKARNFVVVWWLFNCSRRHLGKHLVVI
jgi:hypothetical protein